jgi:hypothetical protein
LDSVFFFALPVGIDYETRKPRLFWGDDMSGRRCIVQSLCWALQQLC